MARMDAAAIAHMIMNTFAEVSVVDSDGASFFFYGAQRKFPFATIVTKDDDFDAYSKLDRPGIFRLNVGVGKATFRSLFTADAEPDFTALDRLMPHPIYGKMYWVSVLNPNETLPEVRRLLAEAHRTAAATS